MKPIVKYCFILLLVLSCENTKKTLTSNLHLEEHIDSLVKTYLDSSKIAGIAIGVYKQNEPLFLKSYGLADLEFDVKLPIDANFEIGSVTKQFTAAAIFQLVEKGMISLDDDFTKYVDFDADGRKISIRQLLTHTSGMKDYPDMPMMKNLRIQSIKRDTLLRIIEKEPHDFEPGESLIYNSTGFFILGLIIEKVSGLSYEDYVMNNLFLKAGMINSYYCSERKMIKNRAHGYELEDGAFVRAGYFHRQWPYAAGALCSTVDDLAKWNTALHTGEILSNKMYQEFISPAILNDGTVTHYAKGIAVLDKNGKTMFMHGGGIDGFRSENRYFPKENVSIILLMNSTGPVSPGKVADYITDWLFGNSLIRRNTVVADLSKYVGTFEGRGRGGNLTVSIIKKDSTLMIQSGNNHPISLLHHGDNTWGNGLSIYHFAGTSDSINELRVDDVYGLYLLRKKN